MNECKPLIRGTPEYMAPESFNLGPAAKDYSVDVWALGCLLYILLGGRGLHSSTSQLNVSAFRG